MCPEFHYGLKRPRAAASEDLGELVVVLDELKAPPRARAGERGREVRGVDRRRGLGRRRGCPARELFDGLVEGESGGQEVERVARLGGEEPRELVQILVRAQRPHRREQ